MRNKYTLSSRGAVVEIPFKGSIRLLQVDAQGLKEMSEAKVWHIYTDRHGIEFARSDAANGQVMLHKLLFDNRGATGKLLWLNRDTLDCRPVNLAWLQWDGTTVLMITPEPVPDLEPVELYTHDSDVRGVYFHKASQRWHGAAFYKGTRYSLGYQPDTQEGKDAAVKAINEFRANGPKVKKGA